MGSPPAHAMLAQVTGTYGATVHHLPCWCGGPLHDLAGLDDAGDVLGLL